MPNWAATKYVLVGSKTNCRNAYEQLKKASNSSNGWLGNLNAFLYPEHITLEKYREKINMWIRYLYGTVEVGFKMSTLLWDVKMRM